MRVFVEATEEDGQGYGMVVRDISPAELLEAARPHADLEAKVWWCEKEQRECKTYGFADAYAPCEYQGGRRIGHEECGFRLKMIAALGADDE